jgi:TRIAD3 protein (E3 ubiquitin-protein ligase RNF216)
MAARPAFPLISGNTSALSDFCCANATRKQFLDETTTIALERNEQEAVLRMAGIENLASCPFCPYAAEYPPIEVDREFRCQAEDCEKISCRLCKLESHIPKSCKENEQDNGLSIRRQIEEAMSAALIRKCNKCGTPFVKQEGCNKMTCTRSGCFNVQCYICSKSCNYDHFNDTRRGGKTGNCPLFENVEARHDNEVKRAEKEAVDKVRAEHPEYTEEDLKVKMSENVKKDDERRKANNPRIRNLAAGVALPG